jgi:short-subunit dehydrogenase
MRSIVITGASSGIGSELAQRAAAKGWSVLLVARRAERLTQTERAITAGKGTCATLCYDVTTRDAAQRIISAAVNAFGRIDVVVNNAGAAQPGQLLQQTDAHIDSQWQLHVAAPLRIARAALPYLEQTAGGLVFIGSGLARVPAPNYGAYALAKAAIRAAAMQLRRELRACGVFVTYVDPGVVDTEFSVASGMQHRTAFWHAQPTTVAARLLRGIEQRRARINAVPWQTMGTVLGEWFPSIADATIASIVSEPAPAPRVDEGHENGTQPVEGGAGDAEGCDDFDRVLEPVRRRMERVNLPQAFVRGMLVPGTTINLPDAAMRWAGMPNKNERAVLREALDALNGAGYVEAKGNEEWVVLRAPE